MAPRNFDLGDLSRLHFVSISDFFNLVGSRVFTEWSGKENQEESDDLDLFLLGNSDNPQHRKKLVEWKILQALELGNLEAFLEFRGKEIDEIHHRVMCRRADNEFYPLAFPAEAKGPPRNGNQREIAAKAVSDAKARFNADPKKFTERFPEADAYFESELPHDLELLAQEALEEFETKRPQQLRLRVLPEAWATENRPDRPIDWKMAVGILRTAYLCIDDERYKLGQGVCIGQTNLNNPRPTENNEVQGFLRIANPGAALVSFKNPPIYPKKWSAWGRQHFDNSKHFWPDYFAIIWAVVALSRDESPSQSQIVEAVENKLAEELDPMGEGLNFPDTSTLHRAVGIVLEQFRTKTINIKATGLMGRPIAMKKQRKR